MKRKVLIAGLATLLVLPMRAAPAQTHEAGQLVVAAESRTMIWNAVAVDQGRVLDRDPSVTAPADRPIRLDGRVVKAPGGTPLRVNSDPLEVSPDGRWLYFAPLPGPWSRIGTRWLDDAGVAPDGLAAKVEAWADLPPVGGTVMDTNGDLYFTDLAEDALKRRTPDGAITTVVRDRVALFNGGKSRTVWPVRLFRLDLGAVR